MAAFFPRDIKNPDGSGYFTVAPTLKIGRDNLDLPLDCVQCVTVVSKLLGPFNEWQSRLRVAKESGYNMIHLTPVQMLGHSNSSYCLADQLQLNPKFGADLDALGQLVEKMKVCTFLQAFISWHFLKQLTDHFYNFSTLTLEYLLFFDCAIHFLHLFKNDWNMLTIGDVIWNHSAVDSPWLKQHPECSYNLGKMLFLIAFMIACMECYFIENSPHLRPAFMLDRALHYFSKEISDGKWESHGIPKQLVSAHQLDVRSQFSF